MGRDLTNIVSISIYKSRKRGDVQPLTEEEAAIQRGIVAWKISNWRAMEEASERRQKEHREKRRKISLNMRLRAPKNRAEFFARSRNPSPKKGGGS